jgi:hypothetical protein
MPGELTAGFDRLMMAIDLFEARITLKFLIYFIAQGLTTTALLFWMIYRLRG